MVGTKCSKCGEREDAILCPKCGGKGLSIWERPDNLRAWVKEFPDDEEIALLAARDLIEDDPSLTLFEALGTPEKADGFHPLSETHPHLDLADLGVAAC